MAKRVFLSFLFAFMCFITILANAYAYTIDDICWNNIGMKQYRPYGMCDTQERTCCWNMMWSEWGKPCPPEDPCVTNPTYPKCCKPTTPKSNTKCWKRIYKWQKVTSGEASCIYRPSGHTYSAYCYNASNPGTSEWKDGRKICEKAMPERSCNFSTCGLSSPEGQRCSGDKCWTGVCRYAGATHGLVRGRVAVSEYKCSATSEYEKTPGW